MTNTVETSVNLPLDGAREARAFVATTVAGWQLHHIARQAVLVGHELVANALRHGGPPIRLRLCRRSGLLCIEVTDAGGGLPAVAEIDNSTSTSGRGLRIVSVLSQGWGVRTHDAGKTVWAEIPILHPFDP